MNFQLFQDIKSAHQIALVQDIKTEKELSSSSSGYHRAHAFQESEILKIQENVQMLEEKHIAEQRKIEGYQDKLNLDMDLLQELIDHLGHHEDMALLIFQYSISDSSEIKVRITIDLKYFFYIN